MHRDLALTTLLTALLVPVTAGAWDSEGAFGLATTLSGSSGIDPENPMISGGLAVSPSLRLSPKASLGVSLSVGTEVTNDEGNDEMHETIVSDAVASLRHGELFKVGDLATVGGFAKAYVPVSEASLFMGLQSAVSIGGQATIPLGPASFTLVSSVQKNFHEATMASLENCDGRRNCSTGAQLTSWAAVNGASLSLSLPGGVGLGLSYTLINGHGYDNNAGTTLADVGVLGGAQGELVGSHTGDDGRHQRFGQAASASLSYEIVPGVGASASIGNQLPQRRANSRDLYNPLIAYRNFGNATVVGFSLTHSL